MARPSMDLSGRRFGKIVVESRSGTDASGHTTWLCKCDCGKTTIVRGSHLKSGNTTSCGCVVAELLREKSTKHGLEHTRIYRIWKDMLSRCYNPKNNRYNRYGKRGITVCEAWKNDLQTFYDWAVTNGYNDNLSIDRIDNDGPYSPENCRWATVKEQMNHTSRNRYITIDGETKTISQWSKITGIRPGTISARLSKGWSEEMAVKKPVQGKKVS